MKDIVIIANFVASLDGGGNSRFLYLANLLSKDNHVELIASDFSHDSKAKRVIDTNAFSCKITLLHEPGYPKNVCLQRFKSHKVWGENVKKYMQERKRPDVVYCAVPSLTAASEVGEYCNKNGIRFLIDIQDLWPEAFQMIFNVPVVSKLIFAPLKALADRAYKVADAVVAVSQTYVDRALEVNTKCKNSMVVFLGTEKATFDKYAAGTEKILKEEGTVRIAYIGTIGNSYDIDTVIDAIRMAKTEKKIEFLVMGDGEKQQAFEAHAKEAGIQAVFTGKLPYPQMCEQLRTCDIAVNPIHKGAAASVINKVADYAMAGLPVINTQECPEYRKLLEDYDAGINCECECVEDVAKAIQSLVSDEDQRNRLAANSAKLGEERFAREKTYQTAVNAILNAAEGVGGVLRLAYVGTVGYSYDLMTAIKAIESLDESRRSKVSFIVMGNGPKLESLKAYAKDLPVVFTGTLPYDEMVWVLSRCNVSMNVIVKGAAQSITNKHADYAMAGKPIINTQECKEYRDLIEEYQAGINCECESVRDVAEAIVKLMDEPEHWERLARNTARLGEERFDRAYAYKKLAELVIE